MKIILTFIFLVISSQFILAQTLIDEYEMSDSDSESARIDVFLTSLNNDPSGKGLIVIYADKKGQRFGNLIGHLEGIKNYLKVRQFDESRVVYIISKGKHSFPAKELWIAEAKENLPKIESYNFDFTNISDRYFYGIRCFTCEPAVPGLESDRIDYKHLADVLNENKNLKLLIVITKGELAQAIEVRKDLGLSESGRVLIRFSKNKGSLSKFYLINSKNKKVYDRSSENR